MMTRIVLTLALLTSLCMSAQNDAPDLPKIFPASPEAATLGKYGEIPVNSATGSASFSIPVFTIQEENLELPISINYRHDGLIVDEVPGHLGIGWSINAGGIITRQVRGRPDEDPAGYIGDQMTGQNKVLPYVLNQLPSSERQEMKIMVNEGILDAQPDKFIVNIGNLNATFYFTAGREIMIMPYKPYQIVPIGNDYSLEQGFKVTDDQGIEYYFQETEETKRIPPVSLSEAAAALLNGYTSSWKVTQIKTPNSGVVNFTYDNPQIHFQRTKSQSYKERISGNCNASPASTSTRDYQITSKLIKEITFPQGRVLFDNEIISVGSANNSNMNKYLSRLDGVSVLDNHNNEINNYALIYDDVNKTRKLLDRVIVNNDSNNLYQFEYNGAPSDNIHWAKQDFWGYYNDNPTNNLLNDLSSFDLYGNRKPDFNKAIIGSLKKITYPTKGSTEISYEPHTVDPLDTDIPYECQSAETNSSVTLTTYLNWQEQENGIHSKYDETIITIEEPYQYVDISMRVEKITSPFDPVDYVPDGDIFGDATAEIVQIGNITDLCGTQACDGEIPADGLLGCQGVITSVQSGPLNNEAELETYNNRVKLNPGQYRIRVEVSNAFGTPPQNMPYDEGDILKSTTTIHFYEDNGEPDPLSAEVGGIRVSKITSCPDDNSNNCLIKEYVYENLEGESLGKLFRKRNITSFDFTSREYLSSPPNANICMSDWKIHSSSSNVPLGFFMGSHVYYNNVKEMNTTVGGVSNGYKENSYIFDVPQQNLTFPFLSIDNREYKNGKVYREKVFNTENELIVENEYDYDFGGGTLVGIDQEAYSVAIGAVFIEYIDFGQTYFADNVTVFRNSSQRNWLVAVTNREWLESELIERLTTSTYTNPNGHIKTQEITGSDLENVKTENTYPYEAGPFNYSGLLSQNNISTPVEVKSYKEGVLLSTLSTEYNTWFTDIVKPYRVHTSKAQDNLVPRLVNAQYDAWGNVLEVKKNQGASTSYIWGYNNRLPVAKLENLGSSLLPTATINNIKNLSNADDDNCGAGGGCSEVALRSALDALRAQFPNALVTTYTYDPLIGPTSITEPGGYTTYYEYDNQNRLQYVTDREGKILEKTEYNYKN